MSKIKVTLNYPISDGLTITFRSPVDSENADSLKIYYPATPGASTNTSAEFTLSDANGENHGNREGIFSDESYVTVTLDTTNNKAYVQNAGHSDRTSIKTGFYEGTGTHGVNGKSHITFPDYFKPFLLFIGDGMGTGKTFTINIGDPLFHVYGDATFNVDKVYDSANKLKTVTLFWYNSSAGEQMNDQGNEYHWTAIGKVSD